MCTLNIYIFFRFEYPLPSSFFIFARLCKHSFLRAKMVPDNSFFDLVFRKRIVGMREVSKGGAMEPPLAHDFATAKSSVLYLCSAAGGKGGCHRMDRQLFPNAG